MVALSDLEKLAREARDLEARKRNLQSSIEAIDQRLRSIYTEELPSMMDDARVSALSLSPEGNLPGYDVEITTHTHANIAASWGEEQRAAAFRWFQENGHGDLIKTEVIGQFPRDARQKALAFVDAAKNLGIRPLVRESIHQQTLTAWLKSQMREGGVIPPLELIGGSCVRVAKLVERRNGNGR